MPSALAPARDRPDTSSRRGANANADPALALHPGAPVPRRDLVARPELVARLCEARDAVLALIVAPPGFGKTTLLAQWAQQDDRPFLWLDARGTTRDDLHLTVRTSFDAFGWPPPVNGRAAPSPRHRAESVVELPAALRARRSVVLVLDDAHTLSAAMLQEIVKAVLAELPRGSTLAVASRTEPALPLGRLRAHRAMVEVHMHDLALATTGAARLLQGAGLDLETEDVAALTGRTEGWPAALYLAAVSLRGGGAGLHPPACVGGHDHLLVDYLSEEVLSALSPELRSFAVRTSVLDELSGPACDAVLGEAGCAGTLLALSRCSELLIALDPERERFRWQHLVADALRAELRRTDPDLERTLRVRASVWYGDHGDGERAIRQAVAAGDRARAGGLLCASLPSRWGHARVGVLARSLSPFAPEEIASCAPLALSAAHAALASGDPAGAHVWALRTAAALRVPDADDPDAVQTGLAVLETMLAKSGAREMTRAALRIHAGQSPDSPWWGLICLLAGTGCHLTGDLVRAERLLEEGADVSETEAPCVQALCLAALVMLAIERSDWSAGAELADRADAAASGELDGHPLTAIVAAAAAAVRAHEGRVDEAKRDLRRGKEMLAELGDFAPWYGAEAKILLAYAAVWLADVSEARSLLADASRLARRLRDAVMFEHWFDDAWAYLDTLAESSLAGPSALTIAELRILRFLPSHRSFREIAGQLGVSANTVKTQAHAVYRKLGVASRSDAVARAAQAGLLGH